MNELLFLISFTKQDIINGSILALVIIIISMGLSYMHDQISPTKGLVDDLKKIRKE